MQVEAAKHELLVQETVGTVGDEPASSSRNLGEFRVMCSRSGLE